MKKMLMIAVMAVACLTANAQNEVGQFTLQPKIGMNIANLTGVKYYVGSMEENSNFMVDFALGVEAEYGLAKNFSLAAGVLYSRQGCDRGKATTISPYTNEESGWNKNQDELGYLNIPIVANYYIAKGFAIKAGIQPGFLLSAKTDIETIGKYTYEEIDKKNFESFDLSIPIGLSYETDNIVIDGRYNLGVTKVNKVGDSSKNSVIQFTLGYKFAL